MLKVFTYRLTATILLLHFAAFHVAAQTAIKRDPRYPAHWWTPISDPSKPDWEILPQEAGSGEVILSKRHELGLLSNFAPTPFTYRGKRYGSLEGFWQMMLYPEGPKDPRAQTPRIVWKYTRDQVAQMTAFEAKSAGTLAEQNMEQISIDWVTFEGKRFKYRSMKPGEHYRLIVEATRDFPSEFEVLHLVLAHRHLVGVVNENVGRLQHRIREDARGRERLLFRFDFELGHALKLAIRGRGRLENPSQLGVLGDL